MRRSQGRPLVNQLLLVLVAADLRLIAAARAEGLLPFNPEAQNQADLDALLSA